MSATIDEGADAAAIDMDALYAQFRARAAALKTGSVGGADALGAEIVTSPLSEVTFKALATVIANATGLDGAAMCKRMQKARGASDGGAAPGAPTPLTALSCATDPEPCANPEPLAKVLDQIVRVIKTRVHCSNVAMDAVALWCVATWGVSGSGPDLFPRLRLFSPMKRCGKSTLLEIVQHVVRRPLAATDTSEAAMFRAIDRWRPTLLIDEADRLFAKSRDLVGLVNSGYSRVGQVIRTVEVQRGGLRTFDPVPFSTYAPVALAGIGRLASTIEDRSIRIALVRQPQGNTHKRIGLSGLMRVREIVGPHLIAHADAIGTAMTVGVPDKTIPASLNDRDADNWRPLLSLAALAGGSWPARAYAAAVELCRETADGDRGPEWALRQIVEGITAYRRDAVEKYQQWIRNGRRAGPPQPGQRVPQRTSACRFIASEDLARWLMAKDDSGFGEYRDTGGAKSRIARVLRPFGLLPNQRKIGGERVRGYTVPAIRAVWRQYRP
jgi:Protein of unknown function (DUF3631)